MYFVVVVVGVVALAVVVRESRCYYYTHSPLQHQTKWFIHSNCLKLRVLHDHSPWVVLAGYAALRRLWGWSTTTTTTTRTAVVYEYVCSINSSTTVASQPCSVELQEPGTAIQTTVYKVFATTLCRNIRRFLHYFPIKTILIFRDRVVV